jgi:hypothetical protein
MQNHNLHIHNQNGTMGHSLSDFYPLIGMMSLVVALTAFGVLTLEQDIMVAFMSYFFLVFGSLKVIRLKEFAEAYRMYDVIAAKSTIYSYAYPFLEIGFGLAYFFAWQIEAISIIVTVVMLLGAYGVYLKLKQKEEVPCACLGTVFKVPMTYVTLAEDLLMAIMALMLI